MNLYLYQLNLGGPTSQTSLEITQTENLVYKKKDTRNNSFVNNFDWKIKL